MKYSLKEIMQGINVHIINTDKFKTNLTGVFISTPLVKDTVTLNALIPAVLRRGSNTLNTQEAISKHLENMYGASFDCGIEKIGDNQVIKFHLETINDIYALNNEKLLETGIKTLFEIIFNPYLENNKFKDEYFKQEKENLQILIESKIDNKGAYAQDRCIEEMYKNEPYSLYRYGFVDDLKNITNEQLITQYKKIIANSKIDIFISGEIKEENILNDIEKLINCVGREPIFIKNNEIKYLKKINIIEEKMDINQGKLIIGLNVEANDDDSKFAVTLYNAILGGSANSKLFQNVREKHSLAYSIRSNYLKQKNNIIIGAGIEIDKYEKAVEVIKEQIKEMENGNFTTKDFEESKEYIISAVKTVEDEQESGITYFLGQELSGLNLSLEEYITKLNAVKIQDVIEVANKIKIDTIYFLRN